MAAKDLVVHDLFLQDTVEWNASLINALLPDYSSEILAIKPSRLGAADKLVWLGQPSGSYSSKSGYHFANNGFSPSPPSTRTDLINWKSDVWGILSAPKVKIFLWKTLQAALPTGQQLLSRHIDVDGNCCRCGEPETILHLLFTCPFA